LTNLDVRAKVRAGKLFIDRTDAKQNQQQEVRHVMTKRADEKYLAVVRDIIENGQYGAYGVAVSAQIRGTITFSLSPEVWQNKVKPQPGFEILVWDIVKKPAGWRALQARLFKPSDD
jgi:hypothetical protein